MVRFSKVDISRILRERTFVGFCGGDRFARAIRHSILGPRNLPSSVLSIILVIIISIIISVIISITISMVSIILIIIIDIRMVLIILWQCHLHHPDYFHVFQVYHHRDHHCQQHHNYNIG